MVEISTSLLSVEKEKIIKTIDLINKKIELQSKKIEDLKLFKKGLTNNIFSNFKVPCRYFVVLFKYI